ncbi:MAG: aquaporin, partial [Actinomycetota bacterium]
MSEELLPPPSAGRPLPHVEPAAPHDDESDLPAGTDPAARNVVTELVGTVVVMVLGPGLLALSDGGVDDLTAAIGFGVGAALAIGVIGAVANPAFTLALLLVREISVREAVGDWIGQLAGAVVGGAVIWGINDQTRVAAGSNGWGRSGFSELGAVMSAELVLGVVVVVVLLGSIGRGASELAIAGFIGLAVAVAHLILVPIDGGGLNPARSIGSALFSDADPGPIGQVWVFVLVPLVAALAAVFVWLAVADAE